jgi:putative transposase
VPIPPSSPQREQPWAIATSNPSAMPLYSSKFCDRTYPSENFEIYDFVIMPDHVHLLITVDENMTIEKAMQLIKGGFSYRLKKEFSYLGEVWQKGFSEVRVHTDEDLLQFRKYIALNPVKPGFVDAPENYPYCFTYLACQKRAGAKAPVR